MVVVISHSPGFLLACAQAKTANANKQQHNVIQTRVLRIVPPDFDHAGFCPRAFNVPQRVFGRKEKISLRPFGLSCTPQRQQRSGHAARCMPHHAFLTGKVARDAPHPQRLDPLDIRHNRRCPLRRIARQRLG